MNESFACDMSAIPTYERPDHLDNIAELFGRVLETREEADGLSFRLPGDDDTLKRIVTFVAKERRCCPFFGFRLDLEPHNGSVWLSLTGPKDAKHVIAAEIGSALPAGLRQRMRA